MKHILKIILGLIVFSSAFMACKKNDNLTKVEAEAVYALGISPVLTSSVATIAPALADSNSAVVKFSWSNPKYANDSSTTK